MGVKPEKQAFENIQIHHNDKLLGVKKQYRARRKKAFICEDKHGNMLIMSQCLSDIVGVINEIVTSTEDRVSLPGMYQSLGKPFFLKHRWKVLPFGLDVAAEAFESVKSGFHHNLIVGVKDSYQIEYAR